MEWYEIEDRLGVAIEQFMEDEAYLLEVDANERSLTHHFATYMKPLFAPYSARSRRVDSLGRLGAIIRARFVPARGILS